MDFPKSVLAGDLLAAAKFAELLPDAVFFRREGIIIHCNSAAVKQYRFTSADDLIGKPSIELLHPDEREGALADRKQLNVPGHPTHPLPRRQLRQDGTEFVGDASMALIDEGAQPTYVMIINDITEHLRLQDSEQNLHGQIADAIDAMDGTVIQFDADDRFVYCNQSFREDFAAIGRFLKPGESFDNITRAMLESGIVPIANGRVEEHLVDVKERHRTGGEPFETLLSDDRWVLTNEYRSRDGGCLIIRTDVTERKLALEAQRQSQRMFRETFHISGIGMSITDMNHCFVEVNDAYCRMTGRTREEIVGANISLVNHPDDMADISDVRAKIFSGGNVDGASIHRLLQPDGSVVWTDVGRRLVRDDDGEPLYIIGQSRDITAHQAAEQALQRSEERYRELFERAPSAFVNLDPDDGHLIHFNQAMTELLGYEESELRRLSIFDVYAAAADGAPLGLSFVNDLIARARTGEEIQKVEFPLRRKTGETVWVLFSVSPGRDYNGLIIELRCVASDITELVATERALASAKLEAEDANESKSMFLANVSHELRTPLNAIIGFSEALKCEIFGGMANDNQAEYIDLINQSGQHLLELINDVLDISAIETGQVALKLERVGLRDLFDEAAHMVEGAANGRQIDIRIDTASSELALDVDRRRFQQILVNLLHNALKFSPKSRTVRLIAKDRIENKDGITISVEDKGVGMTRSEIRLALSLFGQVERHQKVDVPGTGLGLPLTKELVELHGGRLSIESTPGEGTAIVIDLPNRRIFGAT